MTRTRPWLSITLMSVVAMAQNPAGNELQSLLSQRDELQANGRALENDLSELDRQYQADPHAALRDEIREGERVVEDLRRVKVSVQRFTTPDLLPTFDWNADSVRAKVSVLKRDLERRDRANTADKQALRRQIDDKRIAIERNANLRKVLDAAILDVREQQRREASASVLDAVETTVHPSIVTPTNAGAVILNNIPPPPQTQRQSNKPPVQNHRPGTVHPK